MKNKLFSNTGTLVKFILKRELLYSTLWIVGILALTLAVALSLPNLFNSDAERQMMAETMKNPAMVAMAGPVYGTDNYTNGAMMSNMMLLFTIIALAIMNIFLVVKHTRKDEQEGRAEVVHSLPVGRLSNLTATIIVCIIINMILAFLVGFGLYSLKIESIDLHGSILYGNVLGISGILFAMVTALFSQLTPSSRGALGYSFAFLGLSYLIQAGGAANEILSYISPLSFILKVQVYVNNYWWPILTILPIAIVVLFIAFTLNQLRDLGEGLLSAKPGRKNASRFLQTPFALSVRLTRGNFIGWLIGMFMLGLSYGSVMGDLETFLNSNDFFKQILNASGGMSLALQFISMLMSILTIIVTVPTLIMILKLRNEERKHRIENILSKAVSKTKLLSGYFIISFISSILMLFFVILGLWSASYTTMAEPISFNTTLEYGLVYLPAIWVMIGIALLLIAYLPRLTNLIWLYWGFSFFSVYLGRLLNIPEWIAKLSPFGQIPQIPVEDMNWIPLIILSVISILFMGAGFIGYKKRDAVN